MSIIVSGSSFAFANQKNLFTGLSFSITDGMKASLIGSNGSGKTTLLNILAGIIPTATGEISVREPKYMVPQHFGQFDGMTIAEAIGADHKIKSLRSILAGSTETADFECLDDDWDIEDRLRTELGDWGLGHLHPDTPLSTLSGGEKTRAFIAGIGIVQPSVILMDEPTNHLDRTGRERLYDLIGCSTATMLIVSHDRELLNLLDLTLEITPTGIERYGGNYDFYKQMHDEHLQALRERIEEGEKAVRLATLTARKAMERKNKLDARGKKKQEKAGVPKIMMNTMRDGAEKSTTHLKKVLSEKGDKAKEELHNLKSGLRDTSRIKIAVRDSGLHTGKMLVEAEGINFTYPDGKPLWPVPLNLRIESGERISVEGDNGSGKTTLLKIITGKDEPTAGLIKRNTFTYVYVDQEYSFIDNNLTVAGQVEAHNTRNLPEYELKTALHRFLFPSATWDNKCSGLSGGEKMRLMLCCLLISNNSPDMFILDEPTNNLDIDSMEILTSVLRDYEGTLLAISHDRRFLEETGIERTIRLCRQG